MGNPRHYSIELPQRCLTLVEGLWEPIGQIREAEGPDLGPLTTTFLLSMSMPILNIPVERIERHIGLTDSEGYADDRYIDARPVAAFREVIQRGRLRDAPFFNNGAWRFAKFPGAMTNLARGLPDEFAKQLKNEDAVERAANMEASQWISVLRNALAHGGIAYLNSDGRSSYGEPVKMLAFASGKFGDGVCPHDGTKPCRGARGQIDSLLILRISEEDFRDFLRRWVAWLAETGIARS